MALRLAQDADGPNYVVPGGSEAGGSLRRDARGTALDSQPNERPQGGLHSIIMTAELVFQQSLRCSRRLVFAVLSTTTSNHRWPPQFFRLCTSLRLSPMPYAFRLRTAL